MPRYTQTYQYDEMGNILQMAHAANSGNWDRYYHYTSGFTNNYLLSTSPDNVQPGTDHYTYDAHGNMTKMSHLSGMSWDYADRLQFADLGGGGDVYYTYDGGGNRVRKIIENGNIVEERIYLGDYEVYRKTVSGTLNTERETLHISDDAGRNALTDTLTVDNGSTVSTPTTTIRYQTSNHLGSATLELDGSAAIISYEEYHPFGSTAYRSGSSAAEVSLKRYRYVGKERDDETGLYYYGARYYAAWLARFVSVDPLKDDYPFYTSYQYAGNKPIISIDIDGLESSSDIGQQQTFKTVNTETDEEGNILSTTTTEGTVTIGEGGDFKVHLLVTHQDHTSGPVSPLTAEYTLEGTIELPEENTSSGLDRYVPEQAQIDARKWQIENPVQPDQYFIGPGEGFVSEHEKQAREDLYESRQPVAGAGIPIYGPYAQGLKDLSYGNRASAYQNLGRAAFDVASIAATELIAARAITALKGLKAANAGLLRKTANTGAFSHLEVPMQMKYVKHYANQGGIGLEGVKIKILRQADLINYPATGSASGNVIRLYPQAFSSADELVRTLGHERTHIMQYSIYGESKVLNNALPFEKAAYEIEESFIKYWKRNGGY